MAARWSLEDYQPVDERLRAFYEKYPDGRVITDVVYQDADRCIMKTSLYRDHNPNTPVWATGYAEEIRSAKGVNATSHVENCETSSTGRALANANFAPKGARPSREEMEKVQRRERLAAKNQESKPAPKPKEAPPNVDVAALIAATSVAGMDALKALWRDNEAVLDVEVDSWTLRDAIMTRKAELESA